MLLSPAALWFTRRQSGLTCLSSYVLRPVVICTSFTASFFAKMSASPASSPAVSTQSWFDIETLHAPCAVILRRASSSRASTPHRRVKGSRLRRATAAPWPGLGGGALSAAILTTRRRRSSFQQKWRASCHGESRQSTSAHSRGPSSATPPITSTSRLTPLRNGARLCFAAIKSSPVAPQPSFQSQSDLRRARLSHYPAAASSSWGRDNTSHI